MIMARPAGFEPATHGLAYHYAFRRPQGAFFSHEVCGLDYLFALSGAARIVSTDPPDAARGFLGIAIGTTR